MKFGNPVSLHNFFLVDANAENKAEQAAEKTVYL
jgi:hypothetical protein